MQNDIIQELERLSKLKNDGTITEGEFLLLKNSLLGKQNIDAEKQDTTDSGSKVSVLHSKKNVIIAVSSIIIVIIGLLFFLYPKDYNKGTKTEANTVSEQTTANEFYTFGDKIFFGSGGGAKKYLGSGWSANPDANFTWTNGKKAVLSIPITEKLDSTSNKQIEMEINCFAFLVPGKIDNQLIKISVNSNYLSDMVVDSKTAQIRKITIDPKLIQNSKTIEIEFEIPNAVIPEQVIEGNKDKRMLGLGVNYLKLHIL